MLTQCNNMLRVVFSACLLLFICMLVPPASLAATPPGIGKVIALVPGATVTRAGQQQNLEAHAAVMAADIINTDATGRVKILFNDDSMLSIGGNTSLHMREFADSGQNQVFDAHVLQGVARIVTGKIVEANPTGFKVSTPETIVGIRGTIISVLTGNGVTTVYVENTTRKVYVNDINVPGGQKITIPGDSERPVPIQPGDRRAIGLALALRDGNGVAAASPEPARTAYVPMERKLLDTSDCLVPSDTTLADIALTTQSIGDSLTSGGGSGSANTASYAFSGAGLNDFSILRFGFDVDLNSGALSNGYMNGTGNANGPFSLSGGTGSMGGGGAITGFTGTSLAPNGTGIWINPAFNPGDATALIDSVLVTDHSGINIDNAPNITAQKQ